MMVIAGLEDVVNKTAEIEKLKSEIQEIYKSKEEVVKQALSQFIQDNSEYISQISWVQKVQSYDDESYYTVDFAAPCVIFADSWMDSLNDEERDEIEETYEDHDGKYNTEDCELPEFLPEAVRNNITELFSFVERYTDLFEEVLGEGVEVTVSSSGIETEETDWS